MPRVDPAKTDVRIKSSLIMGASRAGKTAFNASWPRPAWIGAEREGGHQTLLHMDPMLWYERDFPPWKYALAARSIQETVSFLREVVEPAIKQDQIRSIIVELSFYSDDIVAALASADGKNGWVPYRTLEEHIRWLDGYLKKLPVLVAYNALAAAADDTKSPGAILLAGKALARKMPAAMDLFGYLRAEDKGQGKVDRVLHLTAYGVQQCGHRFGDKLPPLVRNPTYRALESLITGNAMIDTEGNVTVPAIALPRLAPLPPLRRR